ncbi:Hypothetical predicted protein [Cloeon dipterum]|uniref:Uncharacterized protein n=1 Tax=Cloeon dipterum TaxID=197152 RepID=A0A8S1E5A6_9INSE|nr:Hypothetical predicted protein [Cloeon dipterum]
MDVDPTPSSSLLSSLAAGDEIIEISPNSAEQPLILDFGRDDGNLSDEGDDQRQSNEMEGNENQVSNPQIQETSESGEDTDDLEFEHLEDHGWSSDNNNEAESDTNDAFADPSCNEDDDICQPYKNLPQDEIFPGGPSVADLTLAMMAVMIKHNTTDSLKKDIFGCLNVMLKTTAFPENQYHLKKLYKPATDSMTLHVFCKTCLNYVGKSGAQCLNCGKEVKKSEKEENFFYSASLKSNFRKLNERKSKEYNGLFEEKPRETIEQEEKGFKDVADGSVHAELRGQFGDDINTYNIFCDAAPAFESSRKSIFALMVSPNWLKDTERFRHVSLNTVWVGRKEPPMEVVLKPFVTDASKLAQNGFKWLDHLGREQRTTVVPLVAVADTVARSKILSSSVHNAPYGCPWCYHPNDAEGQAFNRYTHREPNPMLRSQETWEQDLKKALETGNPCRGVAKESILSEIPGFKIPESVGVEQMHAGDVGHTKTTLKIWTRDFTQRNYYIYTPTKRALLNKFVSNIRLPSLSNARLLSSFTEFRSWKASQARIWTVHLSVPLLLEVQKAEHVAVWARFVAGYWLLNQDCVFEGDLIQAQAYLDEHSKAYEYLYGPQTMTSNLHQTTHWPVAVTRLGPLHKYSAYMFEGKFPSLKRDISSSKATAQQIMERSLMREALPIVADQVFKNKKKSSTLCTKSLT